MHREADIKGKSKNVINLSNEASKTLQDSEELLLNMSSVLANATEELYNLISKIAIFYIIRAF